MLSKSAVSEYLNSKVLSFYWVKSKTRRQLRELCFAEYNKNSVGFKFKTRPYLHQYASFYIGLIKKRWFYILDMGLGKTKLVLDLFTYRKNLDNNLKALIMVPVEINLEGWEEEIQKHTNFNCRLLYGGSVAVDSLLHNNNEYDICVITYPALIYYCSTKQVVKGKNKLVIDKKKVKKITSIFNFIGLDEIHNAKNKNTITYRVLNAISKNTEFVYGCSGTPFGRDPSDLWSQFYLIDRGETFGTSLGYFRSMFFNKGTGFAGYTTWDFDKRLDGVLHDKMAGCSIRYEDNECQDLPELVLINKFVYFSEEAFSYYNPAMKLFTANQIDKTYQDVENSFIKLRQLCSGFISLTVDDKKVIVKFSNPSKVEFLRTIVSEVPIDKKMVIFHEFVPSGEIIEEVLDELDIKYISIRGGVKDKIGLIREFKDKKSSVRVLIAHSKTAGIGGNYQQVANYIVFYESPVSPIVRSQCIKRVYRGGQESKKVFIIDLVVKGSVEEKILQYIKEGNNLFDAIVNNKLTIRNIRIPLIQ